jgi:hypothetical protein
MSGEFISGRLWILGVLAFLGAIVFAWFVGRRVRRRQQQLRALRRILEQRHDMDADAALARAWEGVAGDKVSRSPVDLSNAIRRARLRLRESEQGPKPSLEPPPAPPPARPDEHVSGSAVQGPSPEEAASLLRGRMRQPAGIGPKRRSPDHSEGAAYRRLTLNRLYIPEHRADDVICSVFAPPHGRCGAEIAIQAFLHLSEALLQVARSAAELDPTANRRGSATLRTALKRGALVQFFLDCPELIVKSPTSQLVKWEGQPTRVTFTAQVPRTVKADSIEGVLHVGIDDIPIGEISFTLHVDQQDRPMTVRASLPRMASGIVSEDQEQPQATAALSPVGTEAQRYESAFISYARTDFPLVSFFAQGLGEKGIKPCVDLTELEPGDEWEKELPEHIGRADVVYVMWSDAAARSRYVDWEARHAVELYGRDRKPKRPRIKPIPLHQPWPKPPGYLRRFHFYSDWAAHRAAQAAGYTKPAEKDDPPT